MVAGPRGSKLAAEMLQTPDAQPETTSRGWSWVCSAQHLLPRGRHWRTGGLESLLTEGRDPNAPKIEHARNGPKHRLLYAEHVDAAGRGGNKRQRDEHGKRVKQSWSRKQSRLVESRVARGLRRQNKWLWMCSLMITPLPANPCQYFLRTQVAMTRLTGQAAAFA